MRHRINVKISSYTANDIKAGRLVFNTDYNVFNHNIISVEEFEKKLEKSYSKEFLPTCHYCRRITDIIPQSKFHSAGMTLDRIDNSLPHTDLNTVICCLSCNILRSNDMSSRDFKKIFDRL